MIEKLTNVTLFVTDQDKALEFYTQKLGFRIHADHAYAGGPRYVSVGLPGQDLDIVLWKGTPVGPTEVADGGTRGAWVLATADVLKEFERLKSLGVQFEETEPKAAPYALYVTLADPDGNRFVLREPRPEAGAR